MKITLWILFAVFFLSDGLTAAGKRSFEYTKEPCLLSSQPYDRGSGLMKESEYSNPAGSNDFIFEIGIRDELYLMFVNLYDGNSSGPESGLEAGLFPINFHLSAGVKYLDDYKIYITYGIMHIYEDFGGFDGGIFLQAKLLASDFYGTLGIDLLNKSGSSHGLSSSHKKNITFYCFGLGYEVSTHFNIDIMYYVPNDKKFGSDIDQDTYEHYDKINNGILKLGFGYLFSF